VTDIVSDKDSGLNIRVRIDELARGELLAIGGLEIQAKVLKGQALSAIPSLPVGTCTIIYGKGWSAKQ
jgi:hypothetical protein